jgi:hypothetical protein
MHEGFACKLLADRGLDKCECLNTIRALELHGEVYRHDSYYLGLPHLKISGLYLSVSDDIRRPIQSMLASHGCGDYIVGLWNIYLQYLRNVDVTYALKALWTRTSDLHAPLFLLYEDANDEMVRSTLRDVAFLADLYRAMGTSVDMFGDSLVEGGNIHAYMYLVSVSRAICELSRNNVWQALRSYEDVIRNGMSRIISSIMDEDKFMCIANNMKTYEMRGDAYGKANNDQTMEHGRSILNLLKFLSDCAPQSIKWYVSMAKKSLRRFCSSHYKMLLRESRQRSYSRAFCRALYKSD